VSERPARTSAEWTTFAVAVVVLLAVMAAIVVEAVRDHDPARPVADVTRTERVGDDFHVAVTLENRGDRAAANVQVVASLEVNGETTEGDQVVDFLAGGDEEELVFVFADDPDDGKLSVDVAGFSNP
jgi:uncharacterized protein (TIGR02588 family)